MTTTAQVTFTEEIVQAAGVQVQLRKGGQGEPLLVIPSELGVPGWLNAHQELAGNFTYRLEPDSGEISVVDDTGDRPNGLAFSPDESLFYLADTGEPRNVNVFDVAV